MKNAVFIFLFIACGHIIYAQQLTGYVRDAHSDEAVPFASVTIMHTQLGVLTDSAGRFVIAVHPEKNDSLLVTCVGYKAVVAGIRGHDSLVVKLERGVLNDGVIVKSKIDKGLWLWKKIVQHKPENDRYRFDNFAYQLYNKLEVDLKNYKSLERVARLPPMRPMYDLIKRNTDTSTGQKLLPAYLTESLSDYYYQKKPLKRKEEIIAANTNGIKNESMVKYLGGMDQVFNIYNNNLNVFTKDFVSPISDNGDYYYKYNVTDTQTIGNTKYFHLLFTPRRKGLNTFGGDLWVHAGTFAIKKANLYLDKSADVNFLEKFSFIQEFSRLQDSSWFVAREKIVVDIAPAGNKVPGIVGKKTSLYNNVVVNDDNVIKKLDSNKEQEEIITLGGAAEKPMAYWLKARPEALSSQEQGIINMIDTITIAPVYKKITKQVQFLATGYFDVGKLEFGSAYNWFSGNGWEGFRTRFDVATNKYFNKKIRLHAYAAYGFTDRRWKGGADIFYLPDKDPRRYVKLLYINDLEVGQTYYGEITQDNIFSVAARKPGIPRKYISRQEVSASFFNEWRNGFSTFFSAGNIQYMPLERLPLPYQLQAGNRVFNSTALTLRLRFAFQEKFIESQFFRTSLGSAYPVAEVTITKALSHVAGSSYSYTKLLASVSDYLRTPPLGAISYQLYAGRTFGTAPYVFLDAAPGNEMYYYNKYAFNMMNRYEFIHDKFLGLNFEHNIGSGIFRLMPKLKFRQFYTAKSLWGSLSAENKNYNFVTGHPFQSLDGKTYLELGTGIDNILRIFRVDFVWRVLPSSNITDTKKFGIFGSLHFDL